jgi:hypothetical protein
MVSFTPRPLYTRERVPGTHCIGSCVGPRTGLDDVGEKFLDAIGTRNSEFMGSLGLRSKNHCADEGRQKFVSLSVIKRLINRTGKQNWIMFENRDARYSDLCCFRNCTCTHTLGRIDTDLPCDICIYYEGSTGSNLQWAVNKKAAKKNALYKNTYIFKLLPNVVTAEIEALLSGNVFAVCGLSQVLTSSINSHYCWSVVMATRSSSR